MPSILPFPSRDRELERYDDGVESDPDACWDKIQKGMRDLLALGATAKLQVEDAIAALEKNCERTREGAQIVEDPSTRAKLQNDLDFLEQQLKRAKLEAARL